MKSNKLALLSLPVLAGIIVFGIYGWGCEKEDLAPENVSAQQETAAAPVPEAKPMPGAEPFEPIDNQVVVQLSRGACYGSCPVYTIGFSAEGAVYYMGKKFVATEGPKVKNISGRLAANLMNGVQGLNLCNFQPNPNVAEPEDLPAVTLAYKSGGAWCTVTAKTDAKAPQDFFKMADRIVAETGAAEWIKTTGANQPVPAGQTNMN